MLRLFVYGTLKRGGRYHSQYCRGLIDALEATLPGRLYLRPQGYPMLVLPPAFVLAHGTDDLSVDLETLRTWQPGAIDLPPHNEVVHGEVLTFDDLSMLSAIDELEGFQPQGLCDYHRVLVLPQPQSIGPAWTYVAPDGKLPAGARSIPGGRWP